MPMQSQIPSKITYVQEDRARAFILQLSEITFSMKSIFSSPETEDHKVCPLPS